MYMIPCRGFIVVKDTYQKFTQEVHREVIGYCQTLDDAKRIALNEYTARRDFLLTHDLFNDILFEWHDERLELRYDTWPTDYGGPHCTDTYRVLEYELTTKQIDLAE